MKDLGSQNNNPQNGDNSQKPIKGRAALMSMFQNDNPEYNPENDDAFMEDIYNRYSKDKGDFDNLRNANSKLSEVVSRDPRLGLFFSAITDEKTPQSVPYALASIYGNILDLDDEGLEEYENGYKENLTNAAESKKAMEQSSKNFVESKDRIMQYGQSNELNEQQVAQLMAALYDTADNLLDGIIPDWLIDTVHKGLNYEKDIQDTADTAFVEGKNMNVKAKLKDRNKEDEIPDLNNGTGTGKNRQPKPPKREKKDFFDALK